MFSNNGIILDELKWTQYLWSQSSADEVSIWGQCIILLYIYFRIRLMKITFYVSIIPSVQRKWSKNIELWSSKSDMFTSCWRGARTMPWAPTSVHWKTLRLQIYPFVNFTALLHCHILTKTLFALLSSATSNFTVQCCDRFVLAKTPWKRIKVIYALSIVSGSTRIT